MSTKFEKLQRLMSNIQPHSPSVWHPNLIQGCMFWVDLPPGATFNRGWGSFPDPKMPDGITFTPMSPYAYTVEWSAETGNILTRFALAYGEHPTIDFCIEAWQSWQAGEWDSHPDTDGE